MATPAYSWRNPTKTVTVSVLIEGRPETAVEVSVTYPLDAPQSKWRAFMVSVTEALNLVGSVEGLYTVVEGWYTAQLKSLVHGMSYYVRLVRLRAKHDDAASLQPPSPATTISPPS